MSNTSVLHGIVEALYRARGRADGRGPQAVVLHPDDYRQLRLEADDSLLLVDWHVPVTRVMGLPLVESVIQRQGYVGFVFDEEIRIYAAPDPKP